MKVHRVEVQIERPRGDYPGQTVQGRYTFEDGVVTLTDHTGTPVRDRDGKTYSEKVEADGDVRLIAGRLTKQFRIARRGEKSADSNFNRQLHYRNLGIA